MIAATIKTSCARSDGGPLRSRSVRVRRSLSPGRRIVVTSVISTRTISHLEPGLLPRFTDESARAPAYPRGMALEERRLEELERVVDEQAALHRIAILVARGATEADLAAAVSSEVGGLFGAQSASVVRW